MTEDIQNPYSIFRIGAEDGVLFGVYLSVLVLLMMSGFVNSWLSVASIVLMAGVPFYCYRRLRTSYVKSGGFLQVSALWMQGIVMFICGSLILALVAYVYLRWINPSYFHDLSEMTKEMLSDPAYSGQEFSESYIDNIFTIVTPKSYVMELMLLTVFSGSILSLFTAMIVSIKRITKK